MNLFARTLGVFSFLLISLLVFSSPTQAQILDCTAVTTPGNDMTYSTNPADGAVLSPSSDITVVVNHSVATDISNFRIDVCEYNQAVPYCVDSRNLSTTTVSNLSKQATFKASKADDGSFYYELFGKRPTDASPIKLCSGDAFIVRGTSSGPIPPDCSKLKVIPTKFTAGSSSLTITYDSTGIKDNSRYKIKFEGKNEDGTNFFRGSSFFEKNTNTHIFDVSGFSVRMITPEAKALLTRGEDEIMCSIPIRYNKETGDGETGNPGEGEPFALCKQAGANAGLCEACFSKDGIWTAVGCIPVRAASGDATQSVTLMIRSFVTIGLGLAGGVLVLMVLAGSFLLSTSQGDLKRVEEGKSLISSAVIGMLFVIFSVTILRFIGVDILQLPGFGR